MGFVFLIGIGWALCYVFEGKTSEYRAAQDQYWKKLNRELKKQHPSWDKSRRARALWWGARRNALGHFAYQLRHGWWPAAADMRDGFSAARQQHREWVERRLANGEPIPSLRAAVRLGLIRAKEKFQRGKPQPQTDTTGTPATAPDNATPPVRAKVHRLHPVGGGTAASTRNGEQMPETMTGEIGNIGAYRQHLDATVEAAQRRLEEAQAEIAAASQEINAHESANNSLLNAGLGQETAGGMADLMEAAMQRRTAAETRLRAAEQAVSNATAARANLRTQGHENVEQAVQGATAKVGNTSFYEG